MHEVLVKRLFKLALEKVWIGDTDRSAMTLAVDLGCKAKKKNKKKHVTQRRPV